MSRRILDIEVLRGIAVLLVVIHHAHFNFYSWTNPALELFFTYFGGAIGVDLFFAISGFVIARELLPRLEQAAGDNRARVVLAFWVKRAWRLWSSAWLWLMVPLLLVLLLNDSRAFGGVRANVEATMAGLPHVANFRLADVWGRQEYGATAVYWSLSLEEQFYFLLPLLALCLRKYLVWGVCIIALMQLISPRDTMLAVIFRTDALCLGVLLALISRTRAYELARPHSLASRLDSTLSVLLLLTLLLTFGSHHLNVAPYRLSVVAVLVALLVFVASHDGNLLFYKQDWIRRPLVWVGERSYAMYLIHIPCFYLVRELWHRHSGGELPTQDAFMLFTCSAALIVLILSDLNYRFIELPLRRRGARIAQNLLHKEPMQAPTVSATDASLANR
ncbi:hypothetical protein N878_04745 [Pseudomonas sp. EGD-AK9]|uniref:acyltransferase family protein n=1 Tax=Pseudomonas sp. EGD-AK9 TaxID=1386078 RepID=UPI0003985009|nr:acyltransferase [Pseudomonas sp. EGD-AK9]ERI52663.1 hypothetical protein N878_04745 [Pseudomonas sp. EGD-AK9]